MNQQQFATNANFPSCWVEHGLLDGEFFVAQAAAFEAEYGAAKPEGGTEHWRYAAFNHWLGQANEDRLLWHLLEAALADPDPPMAGNVLKAIVGRSTCTESMFEAALAKVSANRWYYVSPSKLRQIFESSRT